MQPVVIAAVDPCVAEAVEVAADVTRGDDVLGERREAVVAGRPRDLLQRLVGEYDLVMNARCDHGHVRGGQLASSTTRPVRGRRSAARVASGLSSLPAPIRSPAP
jgi:hypothetical protein